MIEDPALLLKNFYNMIGPVELNKKMVKDLITSTYPGYYALSETKNPFIVQYVGRSDTDIKGRLNQHIDARETGTENYLFFMFNYPTTVKEAYENECSLYHEESFQPTLENEKHPDQPDGTNYSCPECGHPHKTE